MPPELLSFLEKLPADNSTYKLEWQGLKVNKTYSDLQSRVPQLEHATLLALAILLQHLKLSMFTDEEIIALTELPLQILSVTNKSTSTSKVLNTKTPLFDTESSRIYSFINNSEIVDRNKLHLAANYLDFNNSSLQEIITKLATQGY